MANKIVILDFSTGTTLVVPFIIAEDMEYESSVILSFEKHTGRKCSLDNIQWMEVEEFKLEISNNQI